jgi:hypothetical protein
MARAVRESAFIYIPAAGRVAHSAIAVHQTIPVALTGVGGSSIFEAHTAGGQGSP